MPGAFSCARRQSPPPPPPFSCVQSVRREEQSWERQCEEADRGVRVLSGSPLLRQEKIAAAAAAAGLQLQAISAREAQSRERQCAEVSREVSKCMPGAFSCARR